MMTQDTQRNRRRSGFSIPEFVAVMVIVAVLCALALPALAGIRSLSGLDVSMANLRALSAAHVAYSADWNGRQYSPAPDNLAAYGASYSAALKGYATAKGIPYQSAFKVYIGWNECGSWHFTSVGVELYGLLQPISFTEPHAAFGYFRTDNVAHFNQYVSGKFYAREFFPPHDAVAFPVVEEALDHASGLYNFSGGCGGATTLFFTGYSRSPAALFDPLVMRAPSAGGWVDPWSINTGVNAPPLHAAKHSDLKTHVLEHHWLQNTPKDPCNPAFEGTGIYDGCEPWYFNHGINSSPATLFYDGHVRLLPNSEVKAWDELLFKADGDGLWHRETPLATMWFEHYFHAVAYDDVNLSHHILTIDGILGRDTLGPR
jgi:prepilin-type N-terminal cleavage/methylation domain-containing protein